MKIPEDSVKSNGNVAVCIIDEDGYIYGKMYGKDKIISRRIFKIAWTKASQVWITSMKTGEYEKLVFNNQIDESIYGIETPDLIGWQGGQPVTLKDGTKLSVGFSGFRGISDLNIVVKALSNIKQI
jgi:glc operon protein GlcG